jgi:rRNA processing protein Gar1
VPRSPLEIGKSTVATQNRIVVKLKDGKLPKIGSIAKIQKKKGFIDIGEVIEIIGSTKTPWAVIRMKKDQFDILKEDETIFTEEKPHRGKSKKKVRRKKGDKNRHTKKLRS